MVRSLNKAFTLDDCLFGTLKLIKNADPDKQVYSGYGTGFDVHQDFSVNGKFGQNVVVFCVDNSS